MSKYTKEQLKEMAVRTLKAKEEGDIRYIELIITVANTMNMSVEQVESNIEYLAKN